MVSNTMEDLGVNVIVSVAVFIFIFYDDESRKIKPHGGGIV